MSTETGFLLARRLSRSRCCRRPSARVHAKVADYLAAGTRLVWVVDERRRCVTVYRTLLSPRTVRPDERLDGEDVLPGYDERLTTLSP